VKCESYIRKTQHCFSQELTFTERSNITVIIFCDFFRCWFILSREGGGGGTVILDYRNSTVHAYVRKEKVTGSNGCTALN
jgi:hypothetical protein